MPSAERELHGIRLAVLDDSPFVRTYAGELRPQSDPFHRFVEAVARSGHFADVQYIVPVRHLHIWEVEPPLGPVDESSIEIVPTRPGYTLPGNRGAIDRAVAATDLLCLRLPSRNARLALAAARRHQRPVVGWLESDTGRAGAANLPRDSMPIITPSPELFASLVTADEIEDTRRIQIPDDDKPRRIVWAISGTPHPDEVRRVTAAISELRAAGGRVTLVVLSDRPIHADRGVDLGALAPGDVENYGYVGDRHSYMDVMRGGDVFVHLSSAEGIPNVVVDALAAGLPVVATEGAGVRTILGDGERGRVVPANGPPTFARTMAALLDGANVRATMRASALQWAAANTADMHAVRFGDRLRDLFPTFDW